MNFRSSADEEGGRSVKPRILISRSPETKGLCEAAVEKAGGEPISQHCPDPEQDFDALILAGGGDMDPSEFFEKDIGSYDIDIPRDKAELALIRRCVAENKPILGICRGPGREYCLWRQYLSRSQSPADRGPCPDERWTKPLSFHPDPRNDYVG